MDVHLNSKDCCKKFDLYGGEVMVPEFLKQWLSTLSEEQTLELCEWLTGNEQAISEIIAECISIANNSPASPEEELQINELVLKVCKYVKANNITRLEIPRLRAFLIENGVADVDIERLLKAVLKTLN